MSGFSQFINLQETIERDKPEKCIAICFGRFQPPTKGHMKMIEKVVDLAREKHCDYRIYLSQSHDSKKNPLDPLHKQHYLEQLIPLIAGKTIAEGDHAKNPYSVIEDLIEKGYTKIYFIAGSDRVSSYQAMANRITDDEDVVEVISAGERDPDSDDVGGISGTKARAAAASGDIAKFRVATGWTDERYSDLTREMMGALV